MDKVLIAQKLSEFYMFSELQPAQIEPLANGTRLVDVPRGGVLFNRGDKAHGFYLLLDGQIKLGVISPQGDEKVIGLIQAGESFGEAVLFLERTFPIYAQATLDSKVLLITRDAIFDILDNDVTVVRRMLAGISARNRQLVNDIESISLQNSTQRLIGYLLQISSESPNPERVLLPANKLTIASMLNITPETLSRVMLRLNNVGLIEVNGKEIVITNIAGLRNFE
ncbi:MAG: Crp/Fnr family transcriptional regulator [Methylotenera sp.]|uniref:Crp/Fnr family transcriptional regulator n=1 Tax=Methylotenera sp. TaxID=2051956 RepID=UPI002489BC43|nr:Crp/Fnr family transcriptional regulator [Methylotenera sp.]MDI1310180.1 Crp/Fnr family transcriptional regulator [Methylotenera sp.]